MPKIDLAKHKGYLFVGGFALLFVVAIIIVLTTLGTSSSGSASYSPGPNDYYNMPIASGANITISTINGGKPYFITYMGDNVIQENACNNNTSCFYTAAARYAYQTWTLKYNPSILAYNIYNRDLLNEGTSLMLNRCRGCVNTGQTSFVDFLCCNGTDPTASSSQWVIRHISGNKYAFGNMISGAPVFLAACPGCIPYGNGTCLISGFIFAPITDADAQLTVKIIYSLE